MEKWQEHRTRRGAGTVTAHPVTANPGQGGVVGVPSDDQLSSELTSVRFAQIARQLNQAAKAAGLRTPAFRSPPRTPGATRSIRRRPDGSATVSVVVRGRPAVAVVADMIDGVMAANRHGSTRAAGVQDRLWAAATPFLTGSADRLVPTASPARASDPPAHGSPAHRRAA